VEADTHFLLFEHDTITTPTYELSRLAQQ